MTHHIELTKEYIFKTKSREYKKILVRKDAIDQIEDSHIAMHAGSFEAKETYEEIKYLLLGDVHKEIKQANKAYDAAVARINTLSKENLKLERELNDTQKVLEVVQA